MLTVRPARWPDDMTLLADLDTSFTTDHVYRVAPDPFGFTRIEQTVDPPLHKEYGPIANLAPSLQEMDHAAVAEDEGGLAGIAAARVESWNRRVSVWHLYVASRCRRSGVGTALIHQLDTFAQSAGARCLWVETQNINYPAVQFYQQVGFRLCGLDESLYDPAGMSRIEVALFFVRELA